jgi:NAD(P)-dependent dehydrogenase (short-subunit alcohol dehydrogenase family)
MSDGAAPPLAVVTGASRGIGLEVVRQLAAAGMHVVACGRDVDATRAATSGIDGPVEVARLDVTDDEDAAQLAHALRGRGLEVAVLVNNAGIVPDGDAVGVLDANPAVVAQALQVNVLGAVRVTGALASVLADGARVINVSSGMGQLAQMGGSYLGYRMSKSSLNAFTRVLHAEHEGRLTSASVCPGWVRTDMGGASATRSVEQGAETITWLATCEPAPEGGRFWRDRAQIDW